MEPVFNGGAGGASRVKSPGQQAMIKRKRRIGGRQGEAEMWVLLIAFGALAAVWLVILISAPMLGSDH
jgi:hypothetical protein